MASAVPAQAIEDRLRAMNATGFPVFLWEDPNPELSQAEDPFIVLEFPGGSGQQMTIGAPGYNWFEEEGIFLIHVFYPTATATMPIRTALDGLAEIYRAQEFQGVICEAPGPPSSGKGKRQGLWQALAVSVPYHYRIIA